MDFIDFLLAVAALVVALGARGKLRQLQQHLQWQGQELDQLRSALREQQATVAQLREAAVNMPQASAAAPGQGAAQAAAPASASAVAQASAPAPASAQTPVPTQEPASAQTTIPTPAPAAIQAPDATPAPAAAQTSAPTQTPAAAQAPARASAPTQASAPAQASTSAPPKATSAPMPPRRSAPPPDPAWLVAAKNWLFGGNLVAKLGLLILFIGVSFLLKYAAARVTMPIELRLAGVVLADIALLLWGWRIRSTRAGIALPVQGSALAILMLVTFAAFRLYHLLPASLAFGLLFVLTGFTCLLAILQNAFWLALFGITGGFAAPILVSTGQGSHIALFSYYALLNGGILAIAWHRSWRALNLAGFVFTCLIGTIWGATRYEAEFYWSAQLFLLLFFGFYVVLALIYGARQAPQLKNYVDGTLVFGAPIMAFSLQYPMVKHWPFGVALSSLALGLIYAALALGLWRRRLGSLRLLVESFLALATVFGTLALPFALDGRWTSAAWALEGAGMVWIGLRQRQPLAWGFGLLVQAGAWLAFLLSTSGLDPISAGRANLWLGFLLLAGTAFLMALRFRVYCQTLGSAAGSASGKGADNAADNGTGNVANNGTDNVANNAAGWLASLPLVFLLAATVWLVAGAWVEIFLRIPAHTSHAAASWQISLLGLSGIGTVALLGYLAHSLGWLVARTLGLVLQIITGAVLVVLALLHLDWPGYPADPNLLNGPFLGSLLIGVAALFSAKNLAQNPQNRQTPQNGVTAASGKTLLGWFGFWWFGQILYSFAGWLATHYLIFSGKHDYALALLTCYALLLGASSVLWLRLAGRWQWPQLRHLLWPNWILLAVLSLAFLSALYGDQGLPNWELWLSLLALWLSGEYAVRTWQRADWPLGLPWLKAWHVLRTGMPWLLIWPVGGIWINRWLHGSGDERALLDMAGSFTSASWARYLPCWLMFYIIFWLMQRIRHDVWPVTPLATWYQARLVPLACGWALLLVSIWNISQDGSMAPLPYVPLINPLDLTTGFALLLSLRAWHAVKPLSSPLPFGLGVILWGWFNLILLRTASHVLGVPYSFEPLFDSTVVQTMLSLVWSASALILMRWATQKIQPQRWLLGCALLLVVVAKLFLIDQGKGGSVERIVAFVGVGLLMLAIGYLAPYPGAPKVGRSGAGQSGVGQGGPGQPADPGAGLDQAKSGE
jgi:uncharacterized membrane protein